MERKPESHKGENGKVTVIGGSKDFTGAPALSAQAALRTGCDLAKIVTSEEVSSVVASYSENLIVREYSSGYLGLSGVENCIDAVRWCDVFVIGPGLGNPDSEAVGEILERTNKTAVVDADAIKPALEADLSNAVLTPHRGEAELIKDEYGSVESFVGENEDIVVLVNGETDRVYSDKGVEKVDAGHPGMTVGGTGDVLTGIVASLISQDVSKREAAVKAAEINGEAGEEAAEEYGNSLLATDIIDLIPSVL
ncbi:ADP-dependent NAD(P)H-hydrate dehydratase [Candidatus Nanohalobium constans]|uniref:ADP-dependent (S)-NAD(P)H-hydrate dehydratase n=2 Tax=Candidatus Nanohalobium constans TaxID=2565781 RepID=A0A5Q0UES6_9ARCH|nr:ADP-dependent NAD(P)H-hydrate dehydratase [Candidatus Nanohalobium constans]